MNLVEKGAYFGYPTCCIIYFMRRYNNNKSEVMAKKQHIPGNETGFLPCKSCAQRVLSGEITIAQLITNRECETAFPNDNGAKINAQRKAFRDKIESIIKTT
jgi:hypothetical protein